MTWFMTDQWKSAINNPIAIQHRPVPPTCLEYESLHSAHIMRSWVRGYSESTIIKKQIQLYLFTVPTIVLYSHIGALF